MKKIIVLIAILLMSIATASAFTAEIEGVGSIDKDLPTPLKFMATAHHHFQRYIRF